MAFPRRLDTASSKASESVGCPCMTPAASSTVNIPFIAMAASAIRSLALGPMICTPNSLDLSFCGNHLHHTLGIPMVRGLSVAGELVFAGNIFDSLLLCLFFR